MSVAITSAMVMMTTAMINMNNARNTVSNAADTNPVALIALITMAAVPIIMLLIFVFWRIMR